MNLWRRDRGSGRGRGRAGKGEPREGQALKGAYWPQQPPNKDHDYHDPRSVGVSYCTSAPITAAAYSRIGANIDD